jgi:hypothetical protein
MTEPPVYPLLLLPRPTVGGREKFSRGGGGRRITPPTPAEQERRLGSKFRALQSAIEERRASLTTTLDGADPELVLVFEIATSGEDFANAVRRIPGFEFLAELDEDAIDDADEVFGAGDPEAAAIPGTMYLMATNQNALTAVLDLWNAFAVGNTAAFPHGFGKWREVFAHLLDVRRWSARDRLLGTGAAQDFAARAASGQEVVPAELELWYRASNDRRREAENAVRGVVERSGGSVIASADIEEIAYHGLLVSLPISQVQPILEDAPHEVALLRVEELAFVRPQALVVAPLEDEAEPTLTIDPDDSTVDGPPLVGVLDGVPMLGHATLLGRVMLDDPDDLQSRAQAHLRQHGTAVTSLVANGDLAGDREPLRHPVYHRPVLVPEELFDGRYVERIPADSLPIDLFYRAVRRMFEGDGTLPATAPSVRVINVAIGDESNPLATTMSPWARLLDWLSHHYAVLFVVSAGNHGRMLQFDLSWRDVQGLSERTFRVQTFNSLVSSAHQRRLLSPAESVNALTVGASHDDSTTPAVMGALVDVFPGAASGVEAPPSPISAFGMGYRQSIKPDILAPGGRVLFNRIPAGDTVVPALFQPTRTFRLYPPGLVAAAPTSSGGTHETWHVHGTSFAAALVTHSLGHVMEYLQQLTDVGGNDIPGSHLAVLAKALAVHSAHVPRSAAELREVLASTVTARRMRSAVSRFYGYGVFNPQRIRAGALTRVTLLGSGDLLPAQGHRYSIPLPPSLAGQVVDRRLTITVASLVPVRARDHRHRASEVYFIPDTETLEVDRIDSEWRTVRKGAVQHEVLHGTRAAAFVDGDELAVTVSCRSLAGAHREASLYGLAVTLEVPEETAIPIYTEVASRVRATIEARARVRGARAR